MTTNRGSPPGPASKPPGATFSSLLTQVGPRLLLLVVLVAAENAIVQVETQSEIVAATLDGKRFDLRAFSQSERHRLQFSYYALPDRGFELTLSVRSAAPVKITVQDLSNGLPTIPGMTILPRSANLMPAPEGFGPSDPTIVVKSFTFAR